MTDCPLNSMSQFVCDEFADFPASANRSGWKPSHPITEDVSAQPSQALKLEMQEPRSEIDRILDGCISVPTKPGLTSSTLVCEWDGCYQTFPLSENRAYLFHVQSHAHFMAEMVHEKKYKEFVCWWADCVKPDGILEEMEFARHILYHPFHYKAKVLGLQALEESSLTVPCQLEGGSRNLVPDFPSILACKWDNCTMGFNCISAFEVHVRDHIEDISKDQSKGPKTYQCMWEGCTTFCVRDKAKIQAHIQKHTNLRKFACANCGGTFYNKNKFLEHFKRQAKLGSGYELDKVVYQCSICSKTFQTQLLLRDHIRSHVHNYMCQYCHMTFPTPSGLRKHILYRHKNERKFPCGQCDYRAKEAGDLRVHMEKHLKEKRPKLECPECDYCSFNYDSVTQHMKMKHTENGQNYICHICSKKFGDGRCLSRHLCRVHDFRRPPGVDKFRYTQGPDGLFRLFKDKFESKKLLMTKELQKKAADKLLSLGVISDKEIDLVVRSDSGEEQQMKFVSYHNALKELTKEHSDDEEDSLEDNTISVQVSPCSSQTVPDL